MIVGGVVMIAGPLLGYLGTVLGMMWNFQVLDSSVGVSDPKSLAMGIGGVLVSTLVGLAIGLLGFLVLIIGFLCWLSSRSRSVQPS
jgi:biopolymer transport protein ExbB